MSAVVVAGTVTVVGFTEQAGSSPWLSAPLLLLGIVAVPSIGRQLGELRREELALARLHGIRGVRLAAFATGDALLTLVVGAALGGVLGLAGARFSAERWLPEPARSTTIGLALLVGGGVVVVALLAVGAGMVRIAREPLARALVTARPTSPSTLAAFGTVLVLAAAAVAIYRTSDASADHEDPVVLAGPAVVGLAAGQLAVWGLRHTAGWAVRWSSGSRLASFFAVRRLARIPDAVGALRLLVAATVVATVALAGDRAVDAWTEQTARLRSGAALQIPVDAGALQTLEITRRVDPEGSWLMAAALVDDGGTDADRRVFVDSSRYATVVGDFLDADAFPEGDLVPRLAGPSTVEPSTGDSLSVSGRVASGGHPSPGPLMDLTIAYVTGDRVDYAGVRLRGAADGGLRDVSQPLPACEDGCVVTGLTIEPRYQSLRLTPPRILLDELEFAGDDLLTWRWRSTDDSVRVRPIAATGGLIRRPGGLEIVVPPTLGTLGLEPTTRAAPLTVIATDTVSWEDSLTVTTPGGNDRAATVLARGSALPLVGTEGVLADLPTALASAGPTVPAAEPLVLARADTPAPMLEALAEAGAGVPTGVADLRVETSRDARAQQAQVYLLMAACCVVVALLSVVGSIGRQREARLREAAGLRVVGVPVAEVMRAGRIELLVLAGWAMAAATAAGVVAAQLLLGGFPLVRFPPYSLPVDTTVDAGAGLFAAAVCAGALGLVGLRGLHVLRATSRPAILREVESP